MTLGAAALALPACQTASPPSVETALSPPSLVQGVCGDCHAVEAPFLSPNPAAPPFDAIANREGLDQLSLARWLTDAHNYPDFMEFELSASEAEQIAEYMLTLRSADYRPAE